MAYSPTNVPLDVEYTIGDPNVREYTYPFVAGGVDSAGRSDIEVVYDGVVQPASRYRVRVNANGQGGVITFPTGVDSVPLAQNGLLRIRRNTAAERVTAFGGKGYAPSAAVDAAFGRLVRIAQELAAREDVRSDSLVEITDIEPFARVPGQPGAATITAGDLGAAVRAFALLPGDAKVQLADLGFSLNPHAHSGGAITAGDIASLVKDFAKASPTTPIAASDTDFAARLAQASTLTFNPTTRVLSITAEDGSVRSQTIPGGSVPDADEDTKGIVELATPAEARNASVTDKAVTPQGLASLTSSDTRRGLIEIANQAEGRSGQSGPSGLKAMTPERVADYVAQQIPTDRRLPDPQAASNGRPLVGKGAGLPPAYEALSASQVQVDARGFTGDGRLTTSVDTVQKLAQAVEDLPAGGGGTSLSKATAAQVTAKMDDAAYMTVARTIQAIHEEQVPVRSTLPPRPWRIGTRVILTADAMVRGDPIIQYSERDSSPISNEFALPGQTNAMGPRFIRSYSDAWGRSGNPLRNGVFIDSTTAPLRDAVFIWYPAHETFDAAKHEYAIADTFVAGYQRWYRIGANREGTTLHFAATETGDIEGHGGYHVGIRGWATAGVELYPGVTVESGDITFAGGNEGTAGWIETPGRGLDREEVIALIRQLAPTEAITEIANGPGTGVSIISNQTRYAAYAFDPAFDLSVERNMAGIVEIEANLTMGTPSGGDANANTVGFGTPGQRTIRFSVFEFASKLRELTPSTATARVEGTNGILIGSTPVVASRANNTVTVGTLRLYMDRNASNNLRYWWEWEQESPAVTGFRFPVQVSFVAGFIHQEAGQAAPAELPRGAKGDLIASASLSAAIGTARTFQSITWSVESAFDGSGEDQYQWVNSAALAMPRCVPYPGWVVEVYVDKANNPEPVSCSWINASAINQSATLQTGATVPDLLGSAREFNGQNYEQYYRLGCTPYDGSGTNHRAVNLVFQRNIDEANKDYFQIYGGGQGALLANTTIEVHQWLGGVKGDKGDPGEPGANGTTIPRYASLAALPSPASMDAGARAEVIQEASPYAVMDFAVTGHAAGSRLWKCIGGSSDDLVGTAGIRVPAAEAGTLTADQWYQIQTGTGPATYAEWDFRFPFFQLSFGGAGGPTSGPYWFAAQWFTFDADAIAGLTAGVAGQSSSTSGRFLEVSIWQQNLTRSQDRGTEPNGTPRFRVIRIGRTSTNRILIASRQAIGSVSPNPPHIVPFRVRGHA